LIFDCADHEKKVYSRFSRRISSVVSRGVDVVAMCTSDVVSD